MDLSQRRSSNLEGGGIVRLELLKDLLKTNVYNSQIGSGQKMADSNVSSSDNIKKIKITSKHIKTFLKGKSNNKIK